MMVGVIEAKHLILEARTVIKEYGFRFWVWALWKQLTTNTTFVQLVFKWKQAH